MMTTIREKLARWLAPGSAAPAETRSGYGFGLGLAGYGGYPTHSGPSVSERSALTIAAVWQAVNLYANTLGSLQLCIAEKNSWGPGRRALYHPAYDVLNARPNRHQTSMSLRQAWIAHALTYGNGYLEILWDSQERYPLALELMDPREVEPYRDSVGDLWYRCGRDGDDLPAADVLHLHGFGFDGIKGYSAIRYGVETFGLAQAQRVYQTGLMGNSAQAAGHFESAARMDTKQQAEFRGHWNAIHQGPQNAGNVGIIHGMKWVQTSWSPADAELILSCNFSIAEIARFFNLPQHKLGLLEHATFSNIEEQNRDFYDTSLSPWIVSIEQEMDLKLFGRVERRSYCVRHDARSLTRGNSAAQLARDQFEVTHGIASPNEIRTRNGDDPIDDPGADKHYILANNLVAIEDMKPGVAGPVPIMAVQDAQEGHQPPGGEPPGGAVADPPDASMEPATRAVGPQGSDDRTLAIRALLIDPIGRMVRRECRDVRQAAGKERFDRWLDQFYPRHVADVAEAISPAVAAILAMDGPDLGDPVAIARGMADEHRRQLDDLIVCHPPEEMPDAVARLLGRWDADRPAEIVDHLIGANR